MDTKNIVKENVRIEEIYSKADTFLYTNYDCFKCGKHSLHIYEDRKICQCHNKDCSYWGDVIQVYMDENQCDYITALTALALRLGIEYKPEDEPIILPEQQTLMNKLQDDIIFLGHCRSLIGYYNISFASISSQYGLNPSRFNQVLRGEYNPANISYKEYYKIMAALKTHFIPMFEKYRKELDSTYYAQLQLERNGVSINSMQGLNALHGLFSAHTKLLRKLHRGK